MDNDLDLAALRAFRAVVRTGSFAAAASHLKAPKSTISKRVADLESDLGVRLIERTTRRLRVTSEGEVLAGRAERILNEAEDLRRAMNVSGGEARGHLRIAVPALTGSMVMGQVAAALRRRYPDITLETVHFEGAPDLVAQGFDGALRFGPLEDSGQVAKLLKVAASVVVASPELHDVDTLLEPEDLNRFPIVAMTPGVATNCSFTRGTDALITQIRVTPVLMLGSHLSVRDAVINGAGIATLPYPLVRHDLAEGRLVRLLPDWAAYRKSLYFLYPAPQSVTARLRAFITVLVDVMDETGPWQPDEETSAQPTIPLFNGLLTTRQSSAA